MYSTAIDFFSTHSAPLDECDPTAREILAVVSLQTFYLGKLELLTAFQGRLKFVSVTNFSLAKLPRENFIFLGLNTSKAQKDLPRISLDNYPKATEVYLLVKGRGFHVEGEDFRSRVTIFSNLKRQNKYRITLDIDLMK